MTAGAPRCSSVSRALEESQRGTASVVQSWILLERPGPWGYEALVQSRLSRRLGRELRQRARGLGIRIVLIRRPGRSSPGSARCFFAHTGRTVQRLEGTTLQGGPADLLDLDWSPLAQGRPVGVGGDDRDPLFLVCTNGARDPCCAERGRAVARAMVPVLGDRVWECSHIGGDRFAANLVCFPHGVYFGRLDPDQAAGVALRYREGVIDLDHYRGRSCYDFATQAAEAFVRERRQLRGIDDVRLFRRWGTPGRVEAEFDIPRGRVRVAVAVGAAADPRRLTCHSPAESHPPVYELVSESEVRGRYRQVRGARLQSAGGGGRESSTGGA